MVTKLNFGSHDRVKTAIFGYGTLQLGLAKSSFAHYLTIKKRPEGLEPGTKVLGSAYIERPDMVLRFDKLNGLDALIESLHELRGMMVGDETQATPLLERYQSLIEQTKVYPAQIGVGYAALGLAGEAGEIANKVKKMYRDDNLLNHLQESVVKDAKKDDMKAELGDVLWYVTALAQEFGLTLEEIMQYNIEKLLGRRERGTLQGSGDNR